jgi:hypothetical protein
MVESDAEGSGRGLIWGIIESFSWRQERARRAIAKVVASQAGIRSGHKSEALPLKQLAEFIYFIIFFIIGGVGLKSLGTAATLAYCTNPRW